MDWREKSLTPFSYFVTPMPGLSTLNRSWFPRFSDLPPDIELEVYDSCNAPTLFQLMHTNSRIRAETLKRFWAKSDFWYCCTDTWWERYKAKRIGLIVHCPIFASQITQVEICFARIEIQFRYNPYEEEGKRASVESKARFFWDGVQNSFPSLRRIVLAGPVPSHSSELPGESDDDEKNDDSYSTIARLVRQAPSNITVFVGIERGDNGCASGQCYRLWRVGAASKSAWQVVEESWTPKRVLLPYKKLYNDPLKKYEIMLRKERLLNLEVRGLLWLRLQTYLQCPPGPMAKCPYPGCKPIDRGEWERHIDRPSHRAVSRNYFDDPSRYCDDTPAEVVMNLRRKQERIDGIREDVRQIWLQLRDDWGEENSEKRTRFENTFFAQMKTENYLAPGETLTDSQTWADGFKGRFEPTHVYYSPIR